MGLDWLDSVIDFGAGAADGLTFGLTNKIRGWTGLNSVVDSTSGTYKGGYWTGVAGGAIATGGAAATSRVVVGSGRYAGSVHFAAKTEGVVIHGLGARGRVRMIAQTEATVPAVLIWIRIPQIWSSTRMIQFGKSGANTTNCLTALFRTVIFPF